MNVYKLYGNHDNSNICKFKMGLTFVVKLFIEKYLHCRDVKQNRCN